MNATDFTLANAGQDTVLPTTPLPGQDRRQFLRTVGGGILVFVTLSDRLGAAEAEAPVPRGGRPVVPTDFNAFIRIAEDGRVTCLTGKIEMGQGPITSLAQMVADDLDVPYESVDMLMGDTDLCPWDMGTWGSLTTRQFGPLLRAATTEARGVLLELAAEKLQIPAAQLVARDGVVFVRSDEARRVTYGELAKGQKIERHLAVKLELKDYAQFRVAGRPKLRRDSREKVTGEAKYAGDIRLRGMLYAKVLRPPSHEAKFKSADTSAARAMAGVRVVEDGAFIAVLHELPDVAAEAVTRIKAEYDVPPSTLSDETIHEHLLRVAPAATTVGQGGNLEEGRKLAAHAAESTFFDGYVAHSAMETHAALATIEGDKATVWASTQNPFGARDQIARAIGFPSEKVRVITPYVGGGFGGKTTNGQAVEAARLAKAVGAPVQVMRSREEEFFLDTFRPAAVVKIASGVDGAGRLTFWDYEVVFAGDRGAPHGYAIPHHRTVARPRGFGHAPGAQPFFTGAWRAPGNNTNSFARESQIDLMAVAAGMDPVEFRLKNLDDPRMIRVLKTAAERFGWKPAAGPSKRGFGVACGFDAGTWVALIAEVAVDRSTGQVQVKRVVVAQDMGLVVNPQGATIQIEGCVTMGLGYALSEEVHFKGGEVLDTNFNRYEIPRFSWVPKIESVFIEANDQPPQGGGEPAIIVMGALVANAIHDATGARLYRMPMTPARLKAALAKK